MAGLKVAVVLGVLSLFGLIVALMVRSERKDRAAKWQISQFLGFAPLDPGSGVGRRIVQLYQDIRVNRSQPETDKYEFRNVFGKRLPEGEMFLFDLIDNSGNESSYTERQTVAIISPALNLPAFAIFPRADSDGALPSMANKVLGWVVSRLGNPIEFPQVPEFGQHYLVSPPDPDGTRRFLDDGKLRRLAKTRLLSIHAGGDIFTLSHIDTFAQSLSEEMLRDRVNQARAVFSILVS